ncbi:acyl-CoA reductase [Ramlibacter sp.]|uniref:acyl-CoA reductase n=1 Tax=Ramlibacter sp. TaxID=1917967 RepID=UPI00262D3BFE|nr:acyl-CoA reductase [Ramlibacter sp.]MDB5954368.1 acyl-CoA reductase-like protein [Ramlibacter sp.]
MTMPWAAGHLPGVAAQEVAWHTLSFGAAGERLEVNVPLLTTAQLRALARRVRAASAQHLKTLPVSRIIAIVDRAIARLLDPQDPVRREAERLLPIVSGFDAEMVRLGLNGFAQTFRAPQLHRFVAEDFANPKLLDEFQPAMKGGFVRAFGPDLLVHSWAGNVPALPLWSLVCGLLVKAGTVGKLPSAEPVFATLFVKLLVEVHPPLADCLAIVWWPGGDAASAEAVFGEADTVLAYGGNEAIAQVRAQVPVTSRFLGYGHKLGFGLIARAALDAQRGPATARVAAHDIVRYEQQGCYSPHHFYVERGGRMAPREFALHLAAELANLQRRFPRRALALEEGAAVSGWRQSAELQALAGAGCELFGAADAAWTVACSEQPQPLAPTGGGRGIHVSAVDALEEVVPLLAPHARFLQTVGIAATPQQLHSLAESLGRVGVTRIAALGAMTAPEAGWHHDGRFNLLDLVRMVEIEASAERAADRLAPYAQESLP